MLGAAALSSLAALRTGAGLVTAAVPRGLNLTLQKKIANTIMTMPLAQSRAGAFSLKSLTQIRKVWENFDALAIGPGLGREAGTSQLAREIIRHCPKPLVIDADALFALAGDVDILRRSDGLRILTPHPGEMARLTSKSVPMIEASRQKVARDFACHYNCILLLKGHRTVVASREGKMYINRTGNAGMAKAGSGDVLTGMIAALIAQGIEPYKAACCGAYLHGLAGDAAARDKSKVAMTADDIIEEISPVLKLELSKQG